MTGQRRQAIYVEGLSHKAPIPAAARIGNLVWSGGVSGLDRETQSMPQTIEAETRNMFSNMAATVEAAGGSVDDIIRITVFAADPAEVRESLNAEWIQMFADPDDRPARHLNTAKLHSGMRVQCEFVAVVDE